MRIDNLADILAGLRERARSTKTHIAFTAPELEHMILVLAEEITKLKAKTCEHFWAQYWDMSTNGNVVRCKHCGARKGDTE